MSKQKLDIQLKQGLVLTPQFQQTIRMLNMNHQELGQEIQQMLSQNFMLTPDREEALTRSASEASEEQQDDESSIIEHLSDELSFDADWSDSYADWQDGSASAGDEGQDDALALNAYQPSLCEYLRQQIEYLPLSEALHQAALVLIYSLDNDGYLRERLELLAQQNQVALKDLQQALNLLQQCQPSGIGARDLEECLRLQMQALPPETPYLNVLKRIFERYFHYIGRDSARIKKRLDLSDEDYEGAMQLLRSLTPYPAQDFEDMQGERIQPEIIIKEKHGISYVEMARHLLPHVYINRQYAQLARAAQPQERVLLNAQLQEARWFLSALEKRLDTIRRVAEAIVAMQQDFFQEGELAMRPLTRKEIAESLGIHESTVSRAVNGKFLHCKRGVYELRYFFSQSSGEDFSTTAIKALLSEWVAQEDPKKPLTDQELSERLAAEGHRVPRRTVTKYREQLNIPATPERRQR